MHPQFNQGLQFSNDVALLELQAQVDINEQVSPVCLPNVDVFGDEPAKITGWGKTQGTCCEDWLKQARVPIISEATCKRPDILGSAIGDTMVCAGPLAGGVDTCQGDSGGPLVYKYTNPNGKQVWQLNGITSWGYGCAQPNRPGVYSRVFKFLNWIKQVTDLEPPV
jgi:secreted trypsin-like serine protease